MFIFTCEWKHTIKASLRKVVHLLSSHDSPLTQRSKAQVTQLGWAQSHHRGSFLSNRKTSKTFSTSCLLFLEVVLSKWMLNLWISEVESMYYKANPSACKQVNCSYHPPEFRLKKNNGLFYLFSPNIAWAPKQISETAPASSADTDYHQGSVEVNETMAIQSNQPSMNSVLVGSRCPWSKLMKSRGIVHPGEREAWGFVPWCFFVRMFWRNFEVFVFFGFVWFF